ncbi:MAG: XRE family transcriptional regulator [bacterium]
MPLRRDGVRWTGTTGVAGWVQLCGVQKPRNELILALRHQLAREIVRSLGVGGRAVVCESYGIPRPRCSELVNGRVERCSLEWLIERIERMGGSVRVEVTLGDAGREWRRARFAAHREARRSG